MHRAKLLQIALKSYVIVSPIPKQPLEVMRNRVQQFDHWLVVIAARWGQQQAPDETRETDHTLCNLQPKYFIALLLQTL
ncbi:MAG: hypothetical protein NVS4B12_04590 [Ktedonobacteraceae bacterium]